MSVDLATLAVNITGKGIKETRQDLEGFNQTGKQTSMVAQALSQAFSKAAQTITSAFAAYKLVNFIRDVSMLNARYETLGITLEVAGANAGYNRKEMALLQAQLQKTGISMMESRNTLIQMAASQMDLAESSKLARAAQDLAVVGNTNSSEAFNRLVYGIKSAQTEVLRTLGLNVSFEQSYDRLAKQIGKTTGQLTEQEKLQARTNAVLDASIRYSGIYEKAMGTAGKQMQSMTRYAEDAKVKLGGVFNETLTTAVFAMVGGYKDLNKELDDLTTNKEIEQWGKDLTDIFAGFVDTILNLITAIKVVAVTMAEAKRAFTPESKTEGVIGSVIPGYGMYKGIQRFNQNNTYSEEIDKLFSNQDPVQRMIKDRREAKLKDDLEADAREKVRNENYIRDAKIYYAQLKGLSEKEKREAMIAFYKSRYVEDFPNALGGNDSSSGDKKTKSMDALTNAVKNYKNAIEDASRASDNLNLAGGLAALDNQLARFTISYEQFYQKKDELEQANYDKERARLEAHLLHAQEALAKTKKGTAASFTASADVIKAQSALDALTVQAKNASEEVARQFEAKMLSMGERALTAQVAYLKAIGKSSEATTIEFAKQWGDTIRELVANGNEQGAEFIRNLLPIELAKARFSEISQGIELNQQRLANEEERIQNSRRVGAISDLEALQRTDIARRSYAAAIREQILALQALTDLQPQEIVQLQRLQVELENLQASSNLVADKFNTIFKDAFTDAFSSIIDGTKSVSEAFRSMGNAIVAEINRIIAQQIAAKIFGGMGGGGAGGFLDGLLGKIGLAAISGGTTEASSFSGANTASVMYNSGELKFATGGSFVVGGSGGTDSQDVRFKATPGERVTITTPTQEMSTQTPVNMTVNFTVQGNVDHRTQQQISAQVGSAVNRALMRNR